MRLMQYPKMIIDTNSKKNMMNDYINPGEKEMTIENDLISGDPVFQPGPEDPLPEAGDNAGDGTWQRAWPA